MNIQADIRKLLRESGWSQGRLAQEAGINESALSKFLGRKEGDSIAERLWPFVYGDKRPTPKQDSPVPSGQEEARE